MLDDGFALFVVSTLALVDSVWCGLSGIEGRRQGN